MSKLRALVFFAMVAALAGSAFAADTPFLQTNGTTDQVALFAAFVVNVPGTDESEPIRTAFTISNIMSAPEGILVDDDMTTDQGAITFYLFRADGEVFTVSTADLDSPEALGNGQLNEDGELEAGKTVAFFINELFAAGGGEDETFTGYMWIVCNFDAAAGTYSQFNADLGFSQAFKLDPVLGAGFFFGGLPVQVE